MKAALLARLDSVLRPLAVRLPAPLAVRLYSEGRKLFLSMLIDERPKPYTPPDSYRRVLWGIPFRSPLMNAAGMFKNGEGYEVIALQGAGAYLAGTTTTFAREGNSRAGIRLPFAPYPQSGAASNWLGLPNKGHATVAKKLASLQRINNCPVGISIMSAPESSGQQALQELAEALVMFDKAGVDFVELNESCPNAGHAHSGMKELSDRLEFLSKEVLHKRNRSLPVIVKFSNDTRPEQVSELLDILDTLQYDGINFGNTSTAYQKHRPQIAAPEQNLYEYFTSTFGGGISGRPLAALSLQLASAAVQRLKERPAGREFHVIRTGGIEKAADLAASERVGIALNQWYTGYFEQFAASGHAVYKHLLASG